MTEPTDAEQYLNVADQCSATATNELAASILVDGGSGTLRQLLNDAADAIRAGWSTPQPTQAQAGPVPLTDDELLAMWAGGDERFMRPVLGKNKVLAFGRAVEHRHGIKGGQHGTDN